MQKLVTGHEYLQQNRIYRIKRPQKSLLFNL